MPRGATAQPVNRQNLARRPAIALAAALVVAVAAAAVAPYLIDWRSAIALWFNRAGGELHIAGPVAWRWLPEPELRAAAVTLAQGGQSVTAAAIVLHPSLAALARGRIEAEAARLVDPLLRIGPAPMPPAAIPGLARLQIDNGTLLIDGGPAAGLRLDHVDATLSQGPAPGVRRLEGSFDWRGRRLAADLRTGPAAAGASPLDVSLRAPGSGGVLRFSGVYDGAARRLGGRLDLTLPSLALAGAGLGESLPRAPLGLSGQLAADPAAVRLTSITATLGGLRAGGSAQLSLSPLRRFAVALDLPLLGGSDLAAALAAVPRLTSRLPAGWQGEVALDIGATLWHGIAIQQLQASATIAPGRLTLQQLAALLPGGSKLTARAAIALGPLPRAAGSLTLTSDDSRELLALIGLPLTRIPPDRLRHAAVATGFAWNGSRLELSGLDAEIDDSRITGSLRAALAPGPQVTARLAIDRLNLDAYLPALSGGEAPLAHLGELPALDLDLDVTGAIAGGRPVQRLHLSLSAGEGGGIASLSAAAAALPGIDLPRLDKDPKAAAARPVPGSATAVSELSADFAIIGRDAHSSNARMRLAGGEAQGSLDIDLANGAVSGQGAIHLAAPKAAPAIPVTVSGPLAAPSWRFDLAPLAAFAGGAAK